MSRRTITVEHEGSTYYGEVMTIESTSLGKEDHGILTAYLHLKGDGTGVGVGGYSLDKPAEVGSSHREPTAYGLDHIMQLMRTAGASRWEDLPGRQVVVLFEKPGSWGQVSVGIAHITDEKRVLILQDHAEQWKAREAEAVTA